MKIKNYLLLTGCVIMLTACSSTELDVLKFDQESGKKVTISLDGKKLSYMAFEDISYVNNPVEPELQKINIYIPIEYFEGKSINGYTANTAPIFLPNEIGGYMPANPNSPGINPHDNKPNSLFVALSHGLVVASPGARGRTTATGKAPACIVDLKAAVRYLKYNDDNMFGDANKIISNGTSAGGALSVLLGMSGDSTLYDKYLSKLGAAEASDSILAVSSYCPISILEQADAAYEWQFNGVNDYHKLNISNIDYHVKRELVKGSLTDDEIALSSKLKTQFPQYVNSLNLKDEQGHSLKLDDNGNGSFKDYVASFVKLAAQVSLDAGNSLDNIDFLTIKNNKVQKVDFDKYSKSIGRQKTPPAFDGIDLSTGENQLFGDNENDKKHFTSFSQENSTVQGKLASKEIVALLNPMNFLENQMAAKHWRIRVGTDDKDTSHAISTILATSLKNHNKDCDYKLVWGIPHSGDYDLDELFAWIEKITK